MGNCSSSIVKWRKIHNLSDITLRWEPYLWCKANGSKNPLEYLYLEIPPKGSKKFEKAEYHNHDIRLSRLYDNYDSRLYSLHINVYPASLTPEDPACSSMNGWYFDYMDEIKINYVPGGRVEFDPPNADTKYPSGIDQSAARQFRKELIQSFLYDKHSWTEEDCNLRKLVQSNFETNDNVV